MYHRQAKTISKLAVALTACAFGNAAYGERPFFEGQAVFAKRDGAQFVEGGWPATLHGSHTPMTDGFTLILQAIPIEDTPAAEVVKQIEAGQWLKAIHSIEQINTDDQRYIIDQFGTIRTSGSLKAGLIHSLPEPGRRAFRQLNRSAAQATLDHGRAMTSLAQRAQAYAELIEQYPLCDQAGQAAYELADLHFSQGYFSQAASLYDLAITHPANNAIEPELVARRLIALHRAKRWTAYKELAKSARLRYPNKRIMLAGEPTTLSDIAEQFTPSQQQSAQSQQTTLAVPTGTRRHYTRNLIDPNLYRIMRVMARNYKLENVLHTMLTPHHTVDRGRLFTLSIAGLSRIDPNTGRVLWHHGGTLEFARTRQNKMNQLRSGFYQSVAVADDTVVALMPTEAFMGRSQLIALDADQGQPRWDWKTSAHEFSQMPVYGQALIHDNKVYACCHRPADGMLLLVALDLETGKPVHSIELGKVLYDPRMRSPTELSPRLTMTEQHLLVQTNQGGVIAINRESNAIVWAFSEQIRISGFSMVRTSGHIPPDSVARHTGTIIAQGGLAISKSTRSDTIFAFNERTGSIAWSAQTSPDATVVHTDHRHAYVLGEQFVAYDLKTGERVWWTEHAGPKAGQPLFTDDACIVAGDRRLCQFDLTTGRLTATNESLTEPADLYILGEQLIRITGDRLMSHPLPRRIRKNQHE